MVGYVLLYTVVPYQSNLGNFGKPGLLSFSVVRKVSSLKSYLITIVNIWVLSMKISLSKTAWAKEHITKGNIL